jgi:hypothetical protein
VFFSLFGWIGASGGWPRKEGVPYGVIYATRRFYGLQALNEGTL